MNENVVDIRPDTFLRVIRETGNWKDACAKSGLPNEEIAKLCLSDPEFDMAAIKAHLAWVEDYLIKDSYKRLKAAEEHHMAGFEARHPDAE